MFVLCSVPASRASIAPCLAGQNLALELCGKRKGPNKNKERLLVPGQSRPWSALMLTGHTQMQHAPQSPAFKRAHRAVWCMKQCQAAGKHRAMTMHQHTPTNVVAACRALHTHRRACCPLHCCLIRDDASLDCSVPKVTRHIVHSGHAGRLATPCATE